MAKRRKQTGAAPRLWAMIALLSVILAALMIAALRPTEAPGPTEPPALQTPPTTPTESTPVPPTTEPTVTVPIPTDPPKEGWVEENGQRYYYTAGIPLTGWQTLEGRQFYFREDGAMARGEVEIDGIRHFFTSAGAEVTLVNPWNFIPGDYTVDLIDLPTSISVEGKQIDASCYDALVEMMNACKAAGNRICITSAYRTHEYQAGLYENQVLKQMAALNCSREEAEKVAATISAIPGTSEHQLGLAVDIVDMANWSLSEVQETLPGQIWLMENSWRYGWILRYPNGTTNETGIIYEPWHYRYVGTELAAELHEKGQTLEAYLAALTEK